MIIDDFINSAKSEIVKSVQEIVRIRSVEEQAEPGAPFGQGVNNALLYALNLASSFGFRTYNIDGYMGYAEYGEGSETVGVLGHLDVVPEGNGWMFPPYEGRIHDNKIFGRGTIDDKGPMIAALYGLRAVKDSGLPLSKKIRIMFGTDEESGWLDIKHYIAKELPPPDAGFTPDGVFPVINTEKGAINIVFKKEIVRKSKGMISIKSIKGGEAVNAVPDSCTCELKLKDMAKLMFKDTLELYCQSNDIHMSITEGEVSVIKSMGISAHSSTPEKGKNAISQLIVYLSQFNLGQNDVSDYIKFLAKYVGSGYDGKHFNIKCSDEVSGSLTMNIGKIDINEEYASATVNIRYPVSADADDIIQNIQKAASDNKIEVTVLVQRKPLYVDKENNVIEALLSSYSEVTGAEGYTVSMGGQTYAKAFDNMVAFGPVFPGRDECAHMPNECIHIDDLIKCARIYGRAMYELAR